MLITLNEIGTVGFAERIRKSKEFIVKGDCNVMMFEYDSPTTLHIMSTQIVRINEITIPVFEWVKDEHKKRNWLMEFFSVFQPSSGHYNKVKDVICTSVLMSNNKMFYVSESVDQIKDIVSGKNLKILNG